MGQNWQKLQLQDLLNKVYPKKQILKNMGEARVNITKINKENVETIHISGKRPHNNLERHKPTPSLTLPDPHALPGGTS